MKKLQLNGFHLKLIAVCTMLIDHFAAIVFIRMIQQPMSFWGNWNTEAMIIAYNVMRVIGRMAFPLYLFLLLEGLHYTKNRAKYAGRLALFAIISEIPFDMGFNYTVVEFTYNNVFLTLLIGFLVIWAADELFNRWFADKTWLAAIISFVVTVVGAFLAELLSTDYGAAGIIAIFVFYLCYRKKQPLLGLAAAVIVLALLSSNMEIFALLMLIPLYLYDGTRGKQNKYFFYIFYPAHLLVLDLLVAVLGMMLLY